MDNEVNSIRDMKEEGCPLFKKENLLYERKEKEGFWTVMPKYHPETRELVINHTARGILELCNGKRDIKEIAERMHDKFPQIEKEKILTDAMTIISQFSRLGIIEWIGENPFLWRKETPLFDDFMAMIAQEEDILMIKKFIDESIFQQNKPDDKSFFFYKSPSISSLDYHEVSLRAKIFNFIEEFFLLFKGDELYGIVSISPPLPKQFSSVATINFIAVPFNLFSEFFKFAYEVLPLISISKITKIILLFTNQEDISLEFKEVLLKEGFKEEAFLQHEIDFSVHLRRFAKYYQKSFIEYTEKQKVFITK